MKNKYINLKILCLMIAFGCSFQIFAQTVSSTTVITPVCSNSNGELQITFANVNSYPFMITWSGVGIQNGSDTITSATQSITLIPSLSSYSGLGFKIYLYGPSQTYLGTFEAGMNFDLPTRAISPRCTSPAVFNVNNIRNGTAPYTLTLEDFNGNAIFSGTSPLTIPYSSVCPNSNKEIRLKVTDANGCTNSRNDSFIYMVCNGLNVSMSSTLASCTNGTATVANVTGNTGPLAYAWSNGANTVSLSGLRTGYYTCLVTDTTNCTGMGGVFVQQSVSIFGNATTKSANCNFLDGEATIFANGGTAPYTYLWDNGATGQSVSNLKSGLHFVEIEDANQCIGKTNLFVNSVSPVNVTFVATPSSCTSSTGTATLSISGGQTPYRIVWSGKSSTTNTINNLPPGQQSFEVTDANDCKFNGVVVIPPISVISASVKETNPICPSNNGSIVINASSSAGSLSYLWNNSATTSSLYNIGTGSYSCTITDTNSCSITKNIYLAQVSPVKLNFSSTNASCIFTADGSATAFATGGTAPYTYNWSDGSSTQSIASKKEGIYFVSTTDANGCRSNFSNKVVISYDKSNNSCYCEIKGKVYDDLDSNCAFGNNENGIYNAAINCSGKGTIMTNYNGEYSLKVPAGTYTITELPLYSSKLSPCQSNSQSVTFNTTGSGCNQVVDFANIIIPYHDIVIFPVLNDAPIPGKVFSPKLIVHNDGNTSEGLINATLHNDGKLNLSSASPALTSLGSNHYKPSSPIVLPRGSKQTVYFNYFTPTNLPLGTIIDFRDSAAYQSPIASFWINNEATPWNNIIEYRSVVRSSYDPNLKSVYPKGEGDDGIIGLDQKDFVYVIQFENNGTANADKVVIIDTLDQDFDFTSFRSIDASHDFNAFISPSGVVTFTFEDINLAYTPVGVKNLLAQGYVAFKIKAKNTVKIGDKLQNFSDIYFDYNDPIRTNTTLNTYDKNTTVNEVNSERNGIVLYPNPNNGEMKMLIPEGFGENISLQIFNLQGQLIHSIDAYQSGNTININDLNNGIYFVKVLSANGNVEFLRFVKQ